MSVSALVLPASAATFSDVADRNVATAVEVLRLMGVLDGYADGTFRPDTALTRAQFCKMAVYAMDGSSELGMYSTVTVFPDVKPSHWASAYVNMAAKGKKVIAGYPDGKFYPDRTVTAGQAVTILLRMLGYTDEDIGGVWPISQMSMAQTVGLTSGTGITNGNAALTRGQAAKLFVNLLRADKKDGGTLYQLSEETTLTAIDGAVGEMTTSGGKHYTMVRKVNSSTLTGTQGQVVLNGEGNALTFLPASSGSTGVASGAVIIYEDRSAAALSALTGNNSYQIYKNGIPATAGDLRRYDVATYYAASNSVRVCDTRVTAYYEDCSPSPSAPTTITALGHEFSVLPTAVDTLAKFKPGQVITLLLTADGQVAGAAEGGSVSSTAVGYVNGGSIRLFCGTSSIVLEGAKVSDIGKYEGQVVRISSGTKDAVSLSVVSGGASGDLKVTEKMLGNKKLAENVMVFQNGKETSLSQLSESIVSSGRITYARTNWAGNVDLIVIGGGTATDEIYGRVVRSSDRVWVPNAGHENETPNDGVNGHYITTSTIRIEYGEGKSTGNISSANLVNTGDYVVVTLNQAGTAFTSMSPLTKLSDVSKSAWVGTGAVTYGSRTYTVPADVPCYNRDNGSWMSLEEAMDYSAQSDLYVKDGVVRVIEVRTR